eukprot:scaffold5150_cov193-Alexandrium_tamarense.AAC.1
MSLRNDNARSAYDLRYETMLDCSTNKADKQTDYTSVVLSVALKFPSVTTTTNHNRPTRSPRSFTQRSSSGFADSINIIMFGRAMWRCVAFAQTPVKNQPLIFQSQPQWNFRQLSSYKMGAGTIAPSNTPPQTPAMSLCQMNNHPDYRLQQAKSRVARESKHVTIRTAKPKFTSPKKITVRSTPQGRYNKPVKQHGVSITLNENPVRKNDGTSSGALVADRLRMARRRALESLAIPETAADPMKTLNTKHMNATIVAETRVQEHGISVTPLENPLRSSDGTSSGALVADRLRIVRRRALESMTKKS